MAKVRDRRARRSVIGDSPRQIRAACSRIGDQSVGDRRRTAISFRDDAVSANRKRNDNVAINDEQNAVFLGDIQIENLVAMPENAGELVTMQRRMPLVRRELDELRTSGTFNLGRKISKLSLKSNRAPIDHRSSTVSSIVS